MANKELDKKEPVEDVWVFQQSPDTFHLDKPRVFADMGEKEISLIARAIAHNNEEYKEIKAYIAFEVKYDSIWVDVKCGEDSYVIALTHIDDGCSLDGASEYVDEIKEEDMAEVYQGSTVYALMDWYDHNIETLFSTDWNKEAKPFVIE